MLYDFLNINFIDFRTEHAVRIHQWDCVYLCDPENCICPESKQKNAIHRVSFAGDDDLVEVRVMTESSDDPPQLRQFSSLANEEQTTVSLPTLSITFEQPVANYLAFYRKLSQANVCLENAAVASRLELVGTVKVKNLGQNKSVWIHWTSDCWRSVIDTEAAARPSTETMSQYETFDFNITVPPDIDASTSSQIQFAVCYHADSKEFWDNNGGLNYRVDVMMSTPSNGDSARCVDLTEVSRSSPVRGAAKSDVLRGSPYW